MQIKKLGNQGLKVSELGLGCMGLSYGYGSDISKKSAIEVIRTAYDLGINFFDTAPNYGNGTSELRLGKGLKAFDRDTIVINTKFGHTDTGGTNYESGYIRESLEGSLKRLQIDYVDSLIIHNPPFEYLDGNKNDHYDIQR